MGGQEGESGPAHNVAVMELGQNHLGDGSLEVVKQLKIMALDTRLLSGCVEWGVGR